MEIFPEKTNIFDRNCVVLLAKQMLIETFLFQEEFGEILS